MKNIFIIVLLLSMIGCGKNQEYSTKEIVFESKQLNINIAYPEFDLSNKDTNSKINNEIYKVVLPDIEGVNSEETLLKVLKQQLSDDSQYNSDIQYKLDSKYSVGIGADITSVIIEKYEYFGGAHPNTYIVVRNFDSKGKILNFDDIIKDKASFMKLVKKGFCQLRSLPLDATMEQTGLYVDLDNLPEPIIAFDMNKIKVIYNPYEIAAYGMGRTEIEFEINKLSELLHKR